MIHPSYSELIEAINTNNEEEAQSQVLNSRYSLVLATSKRARQLIAGAKPLVENAAGKKPLAIAIDELYKGKVKILAEKEDEEISLEETDGEAQDDVMLSDTEDTEPEIAEVTDGDTDPEEAEMTDSDTEPENAEMEDGDTEPDETSVSEE